KACLSLGEVPNNGIRRLRPCIARPPIGVKLSSAGQSLKEDAMALKATKAQVWAVTIDDRAGGVADKLEGLANAGASFEMVLARRCELVWRGRRRSLG